MRDVVGEVFTLDQLIEEAETDTSLRPPSLDQFIGQATVKQKLRITLEAAKIRGECMPHILFAGPPGLGKTSLASLIADEMGVELHTTSGPTLTNSGDLAAILTTLEDNDVLFIDEVHRLPHRVQECLYSAMEDGTMDLTLGSGPNAKIIKIRLPKFSLIGATTNTGEINRPMLDRFIVDCRLELYDRGELKKIVVRAAASMGYTITDKAAASIARRGRGTPRIAINQLKRIKDIADILGDGSKEITEELAEMSYDLEGIDKEGLVAVERRYLKVLIEEFQCGPVGVVNMAAKTGESTSSLDQIERFLIQCSFLIKIDKGRLATMKAVKHLGYPVDDYEVGGENNWRN